MTAFEPAEARIVYLLGVLSAVKALSLVMIAGALAGGLGSLAAGAVDMRAVVLWGGGGAALRALASWATTVLATRAAVGEKERLREGIAGVALGEPGVRVGSSAVLATRGLDQVDSYYSTVLPALTNAAVIPLLIGARILFADWLSAWIIVLTLPLVPVFMVLIGMRTRDRVDAASRALARLSDHLVELARGLPVLVGLGRAEEQVTALRKVSDAYRVTTLRTLRTAFMSSLALELISTISVALVAVTIGFRLMGGSLTLTTGLLVLILAPECFSPFREMGAAFHAAQDGRSALRSARDLIARPSTRSISAPGHAVSLRDITVRFAGRATATVSQANVTIAHNTTTLLTGRSGEGKSTLLAVLAGQLRSGSDEYEITGGVTGVDSDRIAWMSQHPHTVQTTVRSELALYGGRSVLVSPDRVDEVLSCIDLGQLADVDPAQLSPGELRRLAFGRVLLRIDDGANLVLLDEPTAHLDPAHAAVIEELIESLHGRVTIVVASHEGSVARLADTVVHVGESSSLRAAHDLAPSETNAALTGVVGTAASAVASSDGMPLGTVNAASVQGSTLRELWRFLRPARGHYVAAIFLGALSTLFAVSLIAVSGWLIVRASQEPEVMYLLVAIIGVRFFGIGRSALRYSERLVAHDAIFRSATELRVRLWKALADNGSRSRKLLRGSTALDYLVAVTDDIRDLSYRAVMPLAVGVVTAVAVVIAFVMLRPEFVWIIVVCLLACLLLVPAAVLVADRSLTERYRERQTEVLRQFTALLGAAADVRTNAVEAPVRSRLKRLDETLVRDARRIAWVSGFGHALALLICCGTAVAMLAAVEPSVASGSLPLELAAVFVLIPLALTEPMLAVINAALLWPSLAAALGKAAAFRDSAPQARERSAAQLDRIDRIEFRDLAVQWPDQTAPVVERLSLTASVGDWVVIDGPSGSGKSTLLSVLLGELAPSAGQYLIDDTDTQTLDGSELRRRITWCPQQGHLFDSTLRANLLLARARDDAPTETEMLGALHRVGLDELLAELTDGLDTRLGSEGRFLSDGQRQRVAVARALLAHSDVVLLDEPTAHLGADDAVALLADLRVALYGKIVVVVTHHASEIEVDDIVVSLGSRQLQES